MANQSAAARLGELVGELGVSSGLPELLDSSIPDEGKRGQIAGQIVAALEAALRKGSGLAGNFW